MVLDLQPSQQLNNKDCSICSEPRKNPMVLPICGHTFCRGCIGEASKKKVCPLCGEQYSLITGNQPPGNIRWTCDSHSLPGYEDYETTIIYYQIPNGIQGTGYFELSYN